MTLLGVIRLVWCAVTVMLNGCDYVVRHVRPIYLASSGVVHARFCWARAVEGNETSIRSALVL